MAIDKKTELSDKRIRDWLADTSAIVRPQRAFVEEKQPSVADQVCFVNRQLNSVCSCLLCCCWRE
jgi:hypothetical protein